MAFGRSKTPTHTDRIWGLAATKEAALSVFAVAANDLEKVVSEAGSVYNEIEGELEYLRAVQAEAAAQADEAGKKAQLIRESFLGV